MNSTDPLPQSLLICSMCMVSNLYISWGTQFSHLILIPSYLCIYSSSKQAPCKFPITSPMTGQCAAIIAAAPLESYARAYADHAARWDSLQELLLMV